MDANKETISTVLSWFLDGFSICEISNLLELDFDLVDQIVEDAFRNDDL